MSADFESIAPEAAVQFYLNPRQDEVSEEILQSHRYRLEQFGKWYRSGSISGLQHSATTIPRRRVPK